MWAILYLNIQVAAHGAPREVEPPGNNNYGQNRQPHRMGNGRIILYRSCTHDPMNSRPTSRSQCPREDLAGTMLSQPELTVRGTCAEAVMLDHATAPLRYLAVCTAGGVRASVSVPAARRMPPSMIIPNANLIRCTTGVPVIWTSKNAGTPARWH